MKRPRRDRIALFSDPAIDGDIIVFICDHAVWEVRATGGIARRRTPRITSITTPIIDNARGILAFAAAHDGPAQVCVSRDTGDNVQQLTHFADPCRVLGWAPDGRVVFTTSSGNPFRQLAFGWLVGEQDARIERLSTRPLFHFSRGAGLSSVIGPPAVNARFWRRYRGGAKGEIWIDRDGNGIYRRIEPMAGNIASPLLCAGRVYFVGDDDDGGLDLFSCTLEGGDLRRHSHEECYAVHSPATDGARIVYCAGGDLYLFDPREGCVRLDIELPEPVVGWRNRQMPVRTNLRSLDVSQADDAIIFSAFGSVFEFQKKSRDPVRLNLDGYITLVRSLPDGRILAISSGMRDDHLISVEADRTRVTPVRTDRSIGRVLAVATAAAGLLVVVCNHRHELISVDLHTGTCIVLDRSRYRTIDQLDLSPDGALAVYAFPVGLHRTVLRLARTDREGGVVTETDPALADFAPRFLPDGSVVFLSVQYAPYPSSALFTSINLLSPVGQGGRSEGMNGGAEDGPIVHNLQAPRNAFSRAIPVHGGIVLLSAPTGRPGGRRQPARLLSRPGDALRLWLSFADEVVAQQDGTFLEWDGDVIQSSRCDENGSVVRDPRSKAARLTVDVNPRALRTAAVRAVSRIAADEVPTRALECVSWADLGDRYAALMDKACSPHDSVQVQDELLGHLRLSHAHVSRQPAQVHLRQGLLGVETELDRATRRWRITKIPRVDPRSGTPMGLAETSLGVTPGDLVIMIDGVALSEVDSPSSLLAGKAGQTVRCKLEGSGLKRRLVTFEALSNDRPLLHADWVFERRRFVSEATQGKVAYLHLPDVSARTRADVEQWILTHDEVHGLIVDLRYNEGGSFGGEIAHSLVRQPFARVRTRWSCERALPTGSGIGPILVVTNRFTSSGGELMAETLRTVTSSRILGEQTLGGGIGHTITRRLPDGCDLLLPEIEAITPPAWAQIENRGVFPDVTTASGLETQMPDQMIVLALREINSLISRLPDSITKDQ